MLSYQAPADCLIGHLLIAMPQMQDERFERSVIYMCAHSDRGAMGLVLNRLLGSVTFPELLEQLEITPPSVEQKIQIHFGGPVEPGRGFVLHSTDYVLDDTMLVDESVGLTATIDILRSIAGGAGPQHCLLALGYAGWGPGQLDAEIQANGWLNVPADQEIIFSRERHSLWEQSLNLIGVNPSALSREAGHA